MPDEYMNSEGDQVPPMPADDQRINDAVKEDKDEGATALLPKSVLGGKEFKVGEEVVLKIVHEYEDEVEVAYATEKAKEPTEKAPPSADEEIDMMAAGNKGGY